MCLYQDLPAEVAHLATEGCMWADVQDSAGLNTPGKEGGRERDETLINGQQRIHTHGCMNTPHVSVQECVPLSPLQSLPYLAA